MDHLRRGNRGFADLLAGGRVVMHPFVLGELSLGGLRSRDAALTDMRALRQARPAADDEVMGLIERKRLWGRGLGWVDVHLLAAALIERTRLWTLDRALASAAAELGVGWA